MIRRKPESVTVEALRATLADLARDHEVWAVRAHMPPDFARQRAVKAIEAVDLLITQLHRFRDRLTFDVRRFDGEHRPHDPRD